MGTLVRCREDDCSRDGRPGPFSAVDRHVLLEHGGGWIESVLEHELTTSPLGKSGRPGSCSEDRAGGASEEETHDDASLALSPWDGERPSDDERQLHEPPDPEELRARAKPRQKPSRAEPWKPSDERLPRKPLSPETRAEIDAAREAIERARTKGPGS